MALNTNEQSEAYRIGAALKYAKAQGYITDAMVAAAGKKQVVTQTVVGTTTEPGNIDVTVVSALLDGGELVIPVAIADNDTASQTATKIRAALNAETDITDHFTVGGTGADYSLTAKVSAANDATLNLKHENDDAVGMTDDTTATATTAGADGTDDLPAAIDALAPIMATSILNREAYAKALEVGVGLGLFTAANIEPLTTVDGLIALTGVPDSYGARAFY